MRFPGWSILLLLGATMSGCLGGDDKPAAVSSSAPPATVSDSTGGIEGVVVNVEVAPIKGAQVGFVGRNLSDTLTDAVGRYSFSNLEPGKYSMQFAKIGFITEPRDVMVKVGEVSYANITLRAQAQATKPYNRTTIEGFYSKAGGVTMEEFVGMADPSACDCFWEFTTNKSLRTIILEPLFTPTVSTGTEGQLFFVLYTKEQYDNDEIGDSTASGFWKSRDRTFVDLNLSTEQTWRLAVVCDTPCVEQHSEVYMTTFFHAAAPRSFSPVRGT